MKPARKDPQTQLSEDEAVTFLVSRVAEQARTDSVPLTENELKQLSFSEETASPEDLAAAADFDTTKDSTEFEAKVAKLLHRAFQHDVRAGKGAVWQRYLAALRNKDVYVLVMVDQAGISRPTPNLATLLVPTSSRGFLRLLPFAVTCVVALCGFLYFVVVPMGSRRSVPYSAPMFPDLMNRLAFNETTRVVFFVAWLGSMLLMWRFFQKIR